MLHKLTRAASTDNNWHNPPSDGASVDEYECVQNKISYETTNSMVSAVIQPPCKVGVQCSTNWASQVFDSQHSSFSF